MLKRVALAGAFGPYWASLDPVHGQNTANITTNEPAPLQASQVIE